MRIYSLTKCDLCLVFVAIAVSFVGILSVGIAGPPVIQTNLITSSYFRPPFSLQSGPFTFTSPTFSSFHQKIWLFAKINILYSENVKVNEKFNISVVLFPISHDGSGSSGISRFTKTRHLICNTNECEPVNVLHFGYIAYSKINLEVSFSHLKNTTVTHISFEFKSYNPTFTQFELWFRFSLVVITFLITGYFAHLMRRFYLRNWTVEQKWIAVVLPLLLLCNGPLYPLNFLYTSWIPAMFNEIFQACFMWGLLMMWLCAYDGISTKTCNFFLPKLFICVPMWILAVLVGIWHQYSQDQDPTFNLKLDTHNFLAIKVVFYALVSTYFLYISYLMVVSFKQNNHFVSIKIKFLTTINLCLIIFCFAFFIMTFGRNVLISREFSNALFHFENSFELVFMYGILNLYVYTLAFMYSPAKHVGNDENSTILS